MLTRILIASQLLAGACEKSDEAKPATKPTEPAPALAGSDAPATSSMDAATYEARTRTLMSDFTAAFSLSGTDCDKLATNINKFIDRNKPLIVEMYAYEKSHPDAKTSLDEKMQADYKKHQKETIFPVLETCAEKKPVQDALARFDELD